MSGGAEALLFSALSPSLLLVVYGLIQWTIGGTRGKDEAVEIWTRALVAALAAVSAMGASVWVGKALAAYYGLTNSTPGPCVSSLEAAQGFDPGAYAEAVDKALRCATQIFAAKFDQIRSSYSAVFETAFATGVVGITSSYSMGLFQAAMPYSGAASGALLALSAAKAVADVAYALALLLGLAAVLIATDRLAPLGGAIAGGAMALPPALAAVADAIRNIDASVGALSYIDWSGLVAATANATTITVYVAVALSLASTTAAAVAYALTKVPAYLSFD